MKQKYKTLFPQLKAELLEEVVEVITYTCPVRGKVSQEVKVKKYASIQNDKEGPMKEKGLLSKIEEDESRVLLSDDE